MRFPWFLFSIACVGSRSADPPDPGSIRQILLTRIQNLGDCLVFVPTVNAVRRLLPHARIDVLTGTSVGASVFEMCPSVDRVVKSRYPSPEGVLKKLDEVEMIRRGRYDAVLLSTEETGMAAKMKAAGIRFRAGFGVIKHMGKTHLEPAPHLLSCVLEQPENTHEVDVNLQLAALLGATDLEAAFDLQPGDAASVSAEAVLDHSRIQGAYCCVHASSNQPVKKWPSQQFASACDAIARSGLSVVFIGSAAESAAVAEIRSLMTQPAVDISGHTNVSELAVVMQRAAAFLGNDSGPMHLAAAVGTPVVAVFVASDPVVWGPYLPEEQRRTFTCDNAQPEAVASAVNDLAGARAQ